MALPGARTSSPPLRRLSRVNCGVATPPLALKVATRSAAQDGGHLRPFPETPRLGSQKPLLAAAAAAAAAGAAQTRRGAERRRAPAAPTEGGAGVGTHCEILNPRGPGGWSVSYSPGPPDKCSIDRSLVPSSFIPLHPSIHSSSIHPPSILQHSVDGGPNRSQVLFQV